MTHEELLARIDLIISIGYAQEGFAEYAANGTKAEQALRAVVELHKPMEDFTNVCGECAFEAVVLYPCPTIQAIEKELL